MTRHIIATALATALVYLIGAFIAWDLTWLPLDTASDRFGVLYCWVALVIMVNILTFATEI